MIFAGCEYAVHLYLPLRACSYSPLILIHSAIHKDNDSRMDSFIASNPGLFRRINHTFVFEAYTATELAKILLIKIEESGFSIEAALKQLVDGKPVVLGRLIQEKTTPRQRERMNGGICDHILRNAKRHLDSRLTIDSPAESLSMYTREDIVAACVACPTPPPTGPDDNDDEPHAAPAVATNQKSWPRVF